MAHDVRAINMQPSLVAHNDHNTNDIRHHHNDHDDDDDDNEQLQWMCFHTQIVEAGKLQPAIWSFADVYDFN